MVGRCAVHNSKWLKAETLQAQLKVHTNENILDGGRPYCPYNVEMSYKGLDFDSNEAAMYNVLRIRITCESELNPLT